MAAALGVAAREFAHQDRAFRVAETLADQLVVPQQKLALGQIKGGPEISYRHKMADGTVIEPSLLLEGIWNFLHDPGAVAIDDHVFEEVRGRVETGLMVYMNGGVRFGASVSYDGIGASDYQAIAGKARLRVPLN